MTNPIAYVLGGLIALSAVADLALNGGTALLFLAKKLMELIVYIQFWH